MNVEMSLSFFSFLSIPFPSLAAEGWMSEGKDKGIERGGGEL